MAGYGKGLGQHQNLDILSQQIANQLPDPVQHELPALLAAGARLWPGAEQEGSGPAGPPVATATPRGMRSFVCRTISLSGM